MTIKNSPLLILGISAAFSAALTHTAMASDISTLVGQVRDSTGPNVTLIIDTSGSMSSEIFMEGDVPFDASVDYVGPFDIHESTGIPKRLFYTLKPNASINYPNENDLDTNTWVTPESFVCAEGQAILQSSGFYTDRFAQFRVDGDSAFWGFLSPVANINDISGPTECITDFGIHGDGSGAGSYPINYTPLPTPATSLYPWSPNADDPRAIDWADTGTRYTFFTPNYLNWIYERKQAGAPVVLSRLEIVQGVAKELVQTLEAGTEISIDDLRLGLMRFSSNGSGGMVVTPTEKIATNSQTLLDQIDALTAGGSTPLAETMFEAYRYHAGGAPRFGLGTAPTLSSDGSLENGIYKSPIVGSCQKSFVILLTDGQPNADFQADVDIEALTAECDGNCLDEMTNYMSTNDLVANTDLEGEQSVNTFTIGFFADFPLLESAATALIDTNDDDIPDTPGYFLANDATQLREAFADIFGAPGLQLDLATFTSPSVSVNSLNRLTNDDTLYFTLYEPSPAGEPHWDGNLKAYKIGRTSDTADLEILDADGDPAVDPRTGVFLSTATSVWSSEPDGFTVSAGGVASRLSAQRNIYSNITSNANLSDEGNRITRDNSDTIVTVPGLPQGEPLLELIDFIAGLDTEGGARKILGDPLHSQPLLINFDGGSDDLLLLFGTNDGFLHAIDPTQTSGSNNDLEYFAFIPKELLAKQPKLKANLRSTDPIGNKVYGMDGPITAWIKGGDDTSDDLVVESGDTLRVYAGMRRGGRSYYALNLTNRENPVLDFVIDNTKSGFGNLGQTWSSASYAKIKLPGDDGEKDVIIFGGGYDPNQDTSNSADSMGNSVYIADAETGELVWSAGNDSSFDLELDAMTHSIPSDVRIIDTNGDGYINRMYVGDMGAQVWRFDINSSAATVDEAITGGRIADLSGDGAANARRFYSAPSVSRYVEDGLGFLAVSLGSGYRADPLDKQIEDNFYVIRDNNVYAPAQSPGANSVPEYGDSNPALLTTEPELIALTVSGIEDGSTSIPAGQFGKGWYLSLDGAGEKSLSSAVTAEGRIFFTTYAPVEPELTCSPTPAVGSGRFYGIDLLTGLPALFDDALLADPVASVLLGPTGIPPQPKLIFVAPDCEGCAGQDASDDGLLVIPNVADIVALVGTQAFNVGLASRPTRTYWIEY